MRVNLTSQIQMISNSIESRTGVRPTGPQLAALRRDREHYCYTEAQAAQYNLLRSDAAQQQGLLMTPNQVGYAPDGRRFDLRSDYSAAVEYATR